MEDEILIESEAVQNHSEEISNNVVQLIMDGISLVATIKSTLSVIENMTTSETESYKVEKDIGIIIGEQSTNILLSNEIMGTTDLNLARTIIEG